LNLVWCPRTVTSQRCQGNAFKSRLHLEEVVGSNPFLVSLIRIMICEYEVIYLRSVCPLAKFLEGVCICEIGHSRILRHGATAQASGQDSCCNPFVLAHHKSACETHAGHVPESSCHLQSISVCPSPGILPTHPSSCS
jgi:hypothetical protein